MKSKPLKIVICILTIIVVLAVTKLIQSLPSIVESLLLNFRPEVTITLNEENNDDESFQEIEDDSQEDFFIPDIDETSTVSEEHDGV